MEGFKREINFIRNQYAIPYSGIQTVQSFCYQFSEIKAFEQLQTMQPQLFTTSQLLSLGATAAEKPRLLQSVRTVRKGRYWNHFYNEPYQNQLLRRGVLEPTFKKNLTRTSLYEGSVKISRQQLMTTSQ